MKTLKSLTATLLALCMVLSLASCAVTPAVDDGPAADETSGMAATPNDPIGDGQDGGNSDEPYIFVHTEFPSGTVTKLYVDIEYDAKPSKGAEIVAIDYISNGRVYKAIYLARNAEIGELGKARVPLFQGENNIAFEVEDSNGKKARFEVENKPIGELDWDKPEREPGKWNVSEEIEGMKYTENWIVVYINRDVDDPREAAAKAAKAIGGKIIGHVTREYYIEVPDSTEQELFAMCEKLMDNYSDILVYALLNMSYIDMSLNAYPTNDTWWRNGDQ